MMTWGPGGDCHVADLCRLGRVAERGVGDRCVVPQELLDRRPDQAGVRAQPRELLGVAEQGDDAVADQAGGRVMSGHDQLEDRREQLLGAEALPAVTRADQPAHQVIARGGLLRLDERRQHRHDRVGRLLARA
jgi:hypothetical protein